MCGAREGRLDLPRRHHLLAQMLLVLPNRAFPPLYGFVLADLDLFGDFIEESIIGQETLAMCFKSVVPLPLPPLQTTHPQEGPKRSKEKNANIPEIMAHNHHTTTKRINRISQ